MIYLFVGPVPARRFSMGQNGHLRGMPYVSGVYAPHCLAFRDVLKVIFG